MSNELKLFFEEKNYGEDLNELYFGLITVKPEFDQFFRKKRPRYLSGEKSSSVDGITIKTINCAEIDVKLDYSEVFKLGQSELIEIICKALLSEISCLTRLSKLKKFDFTLFKSDLKDYLIKQSYLKG